MTKNDNLSVFSPLAQSLTITDYVSVRLTKNNVELKKTIIN